MFKAEYTKNKLHELGMKQTWLSAMMCIYAKCKGVKE